MGSQSGWEQPNGFHPNGLLPNATASVTRVLDPERWTKAEERTAHLLTCIQPDWPSEKHRNAVASYLQDLISKCISCQVFTFGSVPLKTYLPDGDIDLTAFGQNQNLKDNWAIEVRNTLEREEKNEHAKFQVKEVQYIQAEVKLVKCLVDNIVVDISFNQLGGLCTLCFLEEVDYLINQNHLFKRSIILIKAWCYYESRILGAHHGLISTYALETLVLYIFHVFNNCFAGPLEVLYRFLEFFSKFDWENFCVSLWGPVPISSLPNITADPPRKDGKELLLSKKFLGACSYVYSVFPSGNENHDQPFITKFFNVIDPLRTNNNLGRSVNKGNFSRIRSAFAFGAQRLARLLDCPEDNIEAELNLFFMNAWDRHGKGPRPDIAIPDTSHVQSEDSEENIRKTSSMESSTSRHSADEPITVLHSSDNVSSQNGSFPTRQTTRTMNACNLYRKSNQKVNNDSSSSVPPEQDHMSAQRINVSSKSQNDRRRNLREKTLQDEVHSVHQFARTYSSPELTNTSTEVQSQGMYNEAAERRQDKTTSKSDNSSRTRGAKTLQNCSRKSSIDEPSALHNSLQCRFATDVESNHSSDCYDDVSVPKRRDISSGSQMLDMHQGEQDFVEVSPGIQGVGDVQMHMNLASHLPFPMPPSVLGYASQNSGGMVPSNLSSFESHWGSHMHYPQTLIPLPMSPYLTNIRATADQEKMIRGFHGDTLSAESSQLDDDHGEWTEYDADYLREHSPETGSIQTKENERMQTYSSVGFVSSDEAMNSYHYGQEYQHVSTKEKESAERKYCDGPTYRESDAVSCSSSRLSAASVAKCSVAKAPSEHSWDGSPPKIRNSARNELARKVASSMSSAAVDNYEWTNEGESVDHISYEADDEDKDWVPSSTGETFTPSAASSNVEAPQVSGPLHSSYSNLLLPFSPVPIRPVLQQGVSHNHTVLPIAFYPAGPPVPFLTMLPVYNIPTETGTSGASTGHLDVGEGTPKFPETQSSHRPDSVKNVDFSCNSNNSDLVNGNTSVEHAEEHKSDIFNGDFASHWQNLQYGRLCQSSRSQVPFIYSPTVAMPPVQLQGSFQFDHHRRPLPASASPSTQLMSFDHGPTPSPPLQPTSSRPSGVYQQYGGELPRHRTGTGTYFPDPKNFLDRESLSPRLQRGNYSHDRREHHGGREANWIVNSKPRFAGRGHVRYQSDKPGVRMYRSLSRGRQTERHWDKFRLNSNGYHLSNGPSTSSKFSQYVPGNVDYAMYHMASVNSNEVSTTGDAVPSVFMLYPYDQTMGYVSPAEQLKFGSVRTLHEGGIDEVREPNEYLDGAYEPSNYQGNSAESSPDQPSSPSFRGRFHRRP